jgi:cytochrome P450
MHLRHSTGDLGERSRMTAACRAGDRLSEKELFSMVVLLIIAGHETTVSLIGNAVLALLEKPDQLARLKAEPELLPTALEELLRFDGPVERALNRWVAEDLELGGKTMRRGDIVIVILDAANRDSAHFQQADRLDLARTPNRHLAFGRGVHYCLRAPLAQMEVEIALETLFRHFPDLKLASAPEDLSWEPILVSRRLRALPVTWTPVAIGGR